MARKVSNVIGVLGLLAVGVVWFVSLSAARETALLIAHPWLYFFYRRCLSEVSICLTIAATIEGNRRIWIPASVFCVVVATFFYLSHDL